MRARQRLDHVREGDRMPRPVINEEECSACGICVDACPNGVLEIVGESAEPVNDDDCDACATCMEECPMGAISEIEDD
jgi:NAD-dependent dihydropyrimidine dehydrogenase PreA subunit